MPVLPVCCISNAKRKEKKRKDLQKGRPMSVDCKSHFRSCLILSHTHTHKIPFNFILELLYWLIWLGYTVSIWSAWLLSCSAFNLINATGFIPHAQDDVTCYIFHFSPNKAQHLHTVSPEKKKDKYRRDILEFFAFMSWIPKIIHCIVHKNRWNTESRMSVVVLKKKPRWRLKLHSPIFF